MSAERVFYFKEDSPDGTVIEMVVWKVPTDKARPHGFKYRLHYGTQDGNCILRYDNHKGDHRHIREKEEPYEFVSLKKLLADFQADIENLRGIGK